MKKIIVSASLLFAFGSLFAQEALKSTEEEYYDFLSLTGQAERPTLGYRTLSDSEWTVTDENHIWSENNLGSKYMLWENENPAENWFANGIDQSVKVKIYGPEWFNSYNTATPYGQNDGALWQGKGYNTSLTAGARLEAYGFELTFKPQVSYSQNKEFDYISPNYSGSKYANKAATYGYYGVSSIDAPQRFGNSSFYTFDWGDTEARYTWHTFTAGIGTQSIWIGPAKLNPIIHSNNASSYPKFDIGLRKTSIYMPHFDWYLGDIEARGWWGYLSESDYFDNDETNDHNLITGLAVYYQFPFLKEFTVGLNRTMLSKWENKSSYSIFKIYNPKVSSGSSGGSDESDQRVSFTFDYKLENAGFEIYLEWARNDFSPNMDYYVRYPFHTQGWTFGAEKSLDLPFGLKGAILLELTSLECSADYDRLINWYTTFYAHHIITQGYTNQGQWLGAGIGTGGNSQYLGFTLYHHKGSVTLFGQRRNPDLDYTMYIDSRKYSENFSNSIWSAEGNIRAFIDFGLTGTYYLQKNIPVLAKIIFEDEHNPLNVSTNTEGYNVKSNHRYNCSFAFGVKYSF